MNYSCLKKNIFTNVSYTLLPIRGEDKYDILNWRNAQIDILRQQVPCYSHTMEDVHYFSTALNESLIIYKKALEEGFEKYLVGEPTKPVFRKLL